MRERTSNSGQEWLCSVCDRDTVHRIGDRDIIGEAGEASRWEQHGDIRAYRRERQCTECGAITVTIELRADDFETILGRVQTVRHFEEFRETVRTALRRLEMNQPKAAQ